MQSDCGSVSDVVLIIGHRVYRLACTFLLALSAVAKTSVKWPAKLTVSRPEGVFPVNQ